MTPRIILTHSLVQVKGAKRWHDALKVTLRLRPAHGKMCHDPLMMSVMDSGGCAGSMHKMPDTSDKGGQGIKEW